MPKPSNTPPILIDWAKPIAMVRDGAEAELIEKRGEAWLISSEGWMYDADEYGRGESGKPLVRN